MRFIVVGDPHVRPVDLEDAKNLMGFVCDLSFKHHAQVLILGDLHHFHGIIHAEVLAFWHNLFNNTDTIGRDPRFVVLVGNHDLSGGDGSVHSLLAHSPENVCVIDKPKRQDRVLFVPYCSNEALLSVAKNHNDAKLLICHATFNGSKYENGMYAKEGVDPDLFPQQTIVSGHIHTPQEFGKVWYPGAPRALTVSDANIGRSVWFVEIQDGVITERTPYVLDNVCRQLYHFEDTPDRPLDLTTFDAKHQYHIDIKGPSSWINERKPIFAGKARVRTFRTDKPIVKLKESEGIGVAFAKYVQSFSSPHGTSTERLQSMLKARVGHV